MYITLTTPFNPGMNDPGNTYPILHITQITDNRTSSTFQYVYEFGNFGVVKDTYGNNATVWQKGPGALSQVGTISGSAYTSIIATKPVLTTDTAYQSVVRVLLQTLISAGYAGTITGT